MLDKLQTPNLSISHWKSYLLLETFQLLHIPPNFFFPPKTTFSFPFHLSVCAILFVTNAIRPHGDPQSPTHSPRRIYIQPHLLLETLPEVNLAYTLIQLTLSYSANSAIYESYLCMDLSLLQRLSRSLQEYSL